LVVVVLVEMDQIVVTIKQQVVVDLEHF